MGYDGDVWRYLRAFELYTNGRYTPSISMWSLVLLGLFLPVFFMRGGPVFEGLRLSSLPLANLVQFWRPVTDGLLHNDPWQVLWPLVVLGLFGHVVEERLGPRGFHLLVLAALIAGSVFQLCTTVSPWIGFRGPHFAILVAFATIAPHARLLFVPAWLLAAVLVVIELLYVLESLGTNTPHVIGLLGASLGFAVVRWQHLISGPWQRWRRAFSRQLAARRAQQWEGEQAELNRLLDKVSSEGLPALTPQERRFLDRTSRRRRRDETG